jgi:tRNA(adenine34) deaminase
MNLLQTPAAIFTQPPPGWKSWRLVMTRALKQAWRAGRNGEAPIGAVVIDAASGNILAEACNGPIAANDPTAHAEILALRQAGQTLGNYRLNGAILAVTLEPCIMCLGAMVHARIGGLVFGARDPKAGAVVSNLDGPNLPFLNHRFPVLEGILAEECGATLSRFFSARRKEKASGSGR